MMNGTCKKIALFVGGVVFGTAGLKILGSKDAKNVYSQSTAAVLRAKDCIMTTASNIRESGNDILESAREINAERAAQAEAEAAEEVIEDASEEASDNAEA